jgi:large subunit ribosomal protein L6
MSRIGKNPITVPSGVDVTIDGANVRVKGPKGQLELVLVGDVAIERDGETLMVTRADDARGNR